MLILINSLPMAPKPEKGVAYFVYSENFSTSKIVSNRTSIFTAELYGILEAINCRASVAEANIHITTDSKTSVQAIRKLCLRNQVDQKTHKAFRNNDKKIILS